jgi:hypothetical protein
VPTQPDPAQEHDDRRQDPGRQAAQAPSTPAGGER